MSIPSDIRPKATYRLSAHPASSFIEMKNLTRTDETRRDGWQHTFIYTNGPYTTPQVNHTALHAGLLYLRLVDNTADALIGYNGSPAPVGAQGVESQTGLRTVLLLSYCKCTPAKTTAECGTYSTAYTTVCTNCLVCQFLSVFAARIRKVCVDVALFHRNISYLTCCRPVRLGS